jgi:Glycosyltransferases involved in cell wall biogenesis
MKISIVFPIHNECDNLENLLYEWSKGFKELRDTSYEFVIVEDGSTDGT